MPKFHQTEFDRLPELAFRPRGWRGPMTLEGSKGGSSAPAPDSRLVDAQIKSLGNQDSALQSLVSSNEAMAPLQKDQLQFSLDSAKTAYQQSQDDRAWSLDRRAALTGVQDKMIAEANDFNGTDRANQLVAQNGADVSSAFANTRAASDRDLARRGVTPGSGASLAMTGQNAIAEATAKAGGASAARTQARNEGYALEDRANNALAGYPASASAATGASAQYGTAGVGLTGQTAAGINNGYTSAASIAGQMGTNATSMYGAQANYAANMNGGSGFGDTAGGIGALVGAGTRLWTAYKQPTTP
jgi:hypothetical protein